jgi:hypothetical protein
MSAPTVQTANFTATAGAVNYVDARQCAISIDLPDATADLNGLPPAGQVIAYIAITTLLQPVYQDASGNYVNAITRPVHNVTLNPVNGQTINGMSSVTFTERGMYALISDGANFLMTGRQPIYGAV